MAGFVITNITTKSLKFSLFVDAINVDSEVEFLLGSVVTLITIVDLAMVYSSPFEGIGGILVLHVINVLYNVSGI